MIIAIGVIVSEAVNFLLSADRKIH